MSPPEPGTAAAAVGPPTSGEQTLRSAVDRLRGDLVAARLLEQRGPWITPDPDGVVGAVEQWARGQELTLYPHQDAALLELVTGANVILATPTGTGKSLVAMAAHAAALAAGRRSFYTAPIKALVNEKFFALCEVFGADQVGMMTGDAAVNPGAPVICCTAEVFANMALRQGAGAEVDQVVMDEFHYYADPDRGWAWQVPLVELPNAQFLLMSATLGDVGFFADDLRTRTGRASAVIDDAPRPVPLDYAYVFTPVHETIENLLAQDRGPVYVVGFTQAEAMERAQALTSTLKLAGDRKDVIAARIADQRLRTAFGKNLSRYLRHGVGVHHAGMLPRYRRFVERLAQAGLLDVICGTDTLGVGINVPIRTVLFTALGKYDGHSTRHLSAREFHQIAGRAGRAGFDTHGSVVAQAPAHEVLNAKAVAKAGDDPKKVRKVTRKGAAPGSVSWKESTFDRLRTSAPEPLTSHFAVSHAMVLNVLARPGDPFDAMRHLLRENHEPRARQNKHIRDAIAAFRALEAVGVVQRIPEPHGLGRTAALTVDLPEDFALNQALSTFALAALELLDPDSPDYALDVVSVIEATLEDPRPIIRAQRDRARGEAVAQMKADGIEYEERMALLEDVAHPQPLRDLLDVAYDAYRRSHPWVLDHELRPKSVVREMLEQGMGFADLIAAYGLTRSEGTALRYLSDGYRALRAGVPPAARTVDVDQIVAWLGEVVRQTDSSLLEEWERLTDPDEPARHDDVAVRPAQARGVSGNEQAFRVMVRNGMFRLVQLAARERYDDLAALPWSQGWSANQWADALDAYWDEYDEIGTGPDARGPGLFMVDTAPPVDLVAQIAHGRGLAGPAGARRRFWSVRQILADPLGHQDWAITAVVDLDASDEAGEPRLTVTDVG